MYTSTTPNMYIASHNWVTGDIYIQLAQFIIYHSIINVEMI